LEFEKLNDKLKIENIEDLQNKKLADFDIKFIKKNKNLSFLQLVNLATLPYIKK
jgi:hypothetical protein